MKKKKKNCFQMRVTNAQGERVTLKLPEKYRTYFDLAVSDSGYDEYDNSPEAMTRFLEKYFLIDDADKELFQDIVCCELVCPRSLVDLSILTDELDGYAVIRGVGSPSELAEFRLHFSKIFESFLLPESMCRQINARGARNGNGRFYKNNYYFKLPNKM